MVLLHCEGVLQWVCFAASRMGIAMPYTVAFVFDCEGVLQWFDFTVLREGVAATPAYKHYHMFGSLGKLLFGILGLNSLTCLYVRGK